MQELPLLLQHIAAATSSRVDVPGGRILIAGTAGYEGEAAVAAVAHLMHSAASSAHKALVQASQHHMALRVRAQCCAAHSAAGSNTFLPYYMLSWIVLPLLPVKMPQAQAQHHPQAALPWSSTKHAAISRPIGRT